jgi:hypothetical protein
MIRVIHHLADAPAALRQVRTVLQPGATFILEFANKQNLKAILRWLLRRQSWSLFNPDPVEFMALNFDFHPRTMLGWLRAAGLPPRQVRAGVPTSAWACSSPRSARLLASSTGWSAHRPTFTLPASSSTQATRTAHTPPQHLLPVPPSRQRRALDHGDHLLCPSAAAAGAQEHLQLQEPA